MKVWNLAYPRLGKNRELSRAVIDFELGKKDPEQLLEVGKKLLLERWEKQHDCGVDSIPTNDFSFWDHLLDTAWLFNLVPKGVVDADHWLLSQRNLVRGTSAGNIKPLTVRRWFNTSYLCFTPQWDKQNPPKLQMEKINWELGCLKSRPYHTHFTLLGPWTLIQLCETGKKPKSELLSEIIPLYVQLLKDLKKKGVEWVQLEEPSFCGDLDKKDIDSIQKAYQNFTNGCPKLMLSTYYDSPDPWLTDLSELPVQGIHFDLVSGPATLSWIKTRVFPKDKILCLGLVNAQNIWGTGLANVVKQIEILKGFHSESKMVLAPSAPLYHLPLTTRDEKWAEENKDLFLSVCFADERLMELKRLKETLSSSISLAQLEEDERFQRNRLSKLNDKKDFIRNQINRIETPFRKRGSSGAKRQKLQIKKYAMPKLPVSLVENPFPETEHQQWIEKQNEIGVDLVNTDSRHLDERLNDLASNWKGMVPTEFGWIQTLGAHCFRPPIIAGDIEWAPTQALSLFEAGMASAKVQSKVPVLGPLSLHAMSFVRSDLSFEAIGNQLALAIRQEVKTCESRGVNFIQLDEPYLGTGLPLKIGRRTTFHKMCSEIFRLASCGVKDETHVQLSIGQNDLSLFLDFLTKVDVDSIFSNIPVLHSDPIITFKKTGSETGLGPAVISSQQKWPFSEKEVESAIRKAFEFIAPDRLWISGDSFMGFHPISDPTESLKVVVAITKKFRNFLNSLG